MVGFPGETDADFQETLALCRKVRWDAAFMFMYSVREGTAAAQLPDDVPHEVKKARIAELINLQEKISAEKNAALVGSVCEVLIERPSSRNPHDLAGKDRGGRTVIFPGGNARIGDSVHVRVQHSTAHTLMGEIVGVEDFKAGEKSAASKEP
jgi:tRNA-2-methylthio-N6-dimethylallyladenosine synthase